MLRSVPRLPTTTLFALVLALSALTAEGAHAGGWQEVHQTADDVRIVVAKDGIATFEHKLRYRVVAGKFKTLDVGSVDPRGELEPETSIVAEGEGTPLPARVEPNEKKPGLLRIVIDDSKGIGRGAYVVTVKSRLDLVASKIVARDGAMWRLAWTAPAQTEGRDGARVVFEVPAAPTEPRLAASDTAQTTLATVRRLGETDEIELVRPHVPRGEAVTWAARIDPKALSLVTAPELRPPPPLPRPSAIPSQGPAILAAIALAAIAGALAFVLRKKRVLLAAACEARNLAPRPLLPLPARLAGVSPFVYGAAGAGAFAAFSWASPIAGAALVVLAMLLATHRAPVTLVKPRGPGAWREVSGEAVLARGLAPASAGDVLDLATTRGRLVLTALAVAALGIAWTLATRIVGIGAALPLTALVLVPIFATGSRSQQPALPAELAASVLRPARDLLAREVDLAHVDLRLVARFLAGSTTTFDEVRLVCAPIDRTPGLRALELAVAIAAPGPHGAVPEVLVRYDDESPAAARISALLAPRGARVVPGRSAEERVARLVPPDPTPAAAARLLGSLLVSLESRRVEDRPRAPGRMRPYAGPERRVRRWDALAVSG